jgi:hypothetical protein
MSILIIEEPPAGNFIEIVVSSVVQNNNLSGSTVSPIDIPTNPTFNIKIPQ